MLSGTPVQVEPSNRSIRGLAGSSAASRPVSRSSREQIDPPVDSSSIVRPPRSVPSAGEAASIHAGSAVHEGSSHERVQGQVEHPLSELPRTIEGMEQAFKACLNRPVDRGEIAKIVNDVRAYGPAAHRGGVVAANNAEIMQRAEPRVDNYFSAIGMSEHDIRTLLHGSAWHDVSSSWFAGLPYPGASIPINVLQYVVSPVLAATGHNIPSMAVAATAAGVGFLLTGAMQQPLAVLPSEHLTEKYGPSISVDKENVNYREYRPLIADRAKAQAAAHATTGQQFAQDPVRQRVHRDWELEQTVTFLDSIPEDQRDGLRNLATALANSTRETHAIRKGLLATEGAHHRQTLGTKHQFAPRALRPVGQGGFGFLRGAKLEEIAAGLQTIARRQTLNATQVLGLQIAWAVVCQVWQHVGAGFDERNKVRYKAKLDMAYGDLFNAQGNDKLQRGVDLEAADIDEDKCRKRVLGPVQALASRVAKHVSQECEQARAQGQSQVQQVLEADLAHLRSGDLTLLSADGSARRLMLKGATKGVFMSLFDSDSVLRRDIQSKANAKEYKAQVIQRGTQSYQMLAFGGTASALASKSVTTAFGSASKTPTEWLAGFLVFNVFVAVVAGLTAPETQTLKNFGKEGDPAPKTAGQVGRGLISGYEQVAGRWKAADANEVIRNTLDRYHDESLVAQLLVDAFGAYDANRSSSTG